ncbi:hypothetical protein [Rosistilla oblonga]|uniref:hypothetical protein n=1 Tax=Rosistilla oblonga TaxID=2527990 RepID=UPI003A9706EE
MKKIHLPRYTELAQEWAMRNAWGYNRTVLNEPAGNHLVRLARHANRDGSVNMTLDKMVDMFGISRSTAQRRMEYLREHGFVVAKGTGSSCQYYLQVNLVGLKVKVSERGVVLFGSASEKEYGYADNDTQGYVCKMDGTVIGGTISDTCVGKGQDDIKHDASSCDTIGIKSNTKNVVSCSNRKQASYIRKDDKKDNNMEPTNTLFPEDNQGNVDPLCKIDFPAIVSSKDKTLTKKRMTADEAERFRAAAKRAKLDPDSVYDDCVTCFTAAPPSKRKVDPYKTALNWLKRTRPQSNANNGSDCYIDSVAVENGLDPKQFRQAYVAMYAAYGYTYAQQPVDEYAALVLRMMRENDANQESAQAIIHERVKAFGESRTRLAEDAKGYVKGLRHWLTNAQCDIPAASQCAGLEVIPRSGGGIREIRADRSREVAPIKNL